MKLLGSTKKVIDKTKNGENQYQQNSEVLYTLRPINLMLTC